MSKEISGLLRKYEKKKEFAIHGFLFTLFQNKISDYLNRSSHSKDGGGNKRRIGRKTLERISKWNSNKKVEKIPRTCRKSMSYVHVISVHDDE